jgi:phosphoribosylglycinamide formyltransferase 1
MIDAIASKTLNAEIVLVVSNQAEAPALLRAAEHGLPSVIVSAKDHPKREGFDEAMIQALDKAQVDLVAMAGFMRILSPSFVQHFKGRLVNIHPSLLPAFPGLNGIQQAYDYGVKYTGCTVHFVDEGVDTGPIIGQSIIDVKDEESLESLEERIHKEEHKLYPRVLQWIAEKKVSFPRGGRKCTKV